MTGHDTATVTIEKLIPGGKGLAHEGTLATFVRGAIPGETVIVRPERSRHGFQEARIQDVLVPSPDRVAPPCPVYSRCGGCQLQHLRYEAQLEHKRAMLRETLDRLAGIPLDIPQVIPSPCPFGYRRTVRFTVFREAGRLALGYYEPGSHRPVAASHCRLVPDEMRQTIEAVDERLGQGALPLRVDAIEVRASHATGNTLLTFWTGPARPVRIDDLLQTFEGIPAVVGCMVYRVGSGRDGGVHGKYARRMGRIVRGQDWVHDRLDGLLFRISDRSFVQPNWSLAETLSRMLTRWIAPVEPRGARVLELYAGIGTLGLPLARAGALVTLVEANPWAVADAREAARINHIGRCRFRSLPAESYLEQIRPDEYDSVLMDPPRTGLSAPCLEHLIRLAPPRLVYVSCDMATLARDLKRLTQAGYRIPRLQPFDMFPQTAHLETLVELVR